MVVVIVTTVKMSKPNIAIVKSYKCFPAKRGDASRDTQFVQLWRKDPTSAILETQ